MKKCLFLLLSFIFQLNASQKYIDLNVQIINEKTEDTHFIPISVENTGTIEDVVKQTLRQTFPETPVDEVSVMHRGSPVLLSESVGIIKNPHRLVLWIKNTNIHERIRSHSAPVKHSNIKIITVFYGHQTEQFELYPKTTWKDLKKQIYQQFHVKPIDPDDEDLARIALEKDMKEGIASHTSQRIVDGRLREYVLDTFKRDQIHEPTFYLYLQPFKNQYARFDIAGKSMEQLEKEQRIKQLAQAIAPDMKKHGLSRLKLRRAVNMLKMGYNQLGELEVYRSLAESLQNVSQQEQDMLFNNISQALRQEYYQEQQQNELLLQERVDFAEQDLAEEAHYDAMMEALVLQELGDVTEQPKMPIIQKPIAIKPIPMINIQQPSDDEDDEETF